MNNRQIQGVCAEAQERQARLTRSFFEASQELVDRVRRGQAADRNFAREGPMDHYVAFLEGLFFYSRGVSVAAGRGDCRFHNSTTRKAEATSLPGDAGQDQGGNLEASTLQYYLRGIESFPVQKEEVASIAEGNGAPQDMVEQIRNAGTERFDSPEEVMQVLQQGRS